MEEKLGLHMGVSRWEKWRELGLLVDEGVPLEFGRDMWKLESHLGVQDACVLSEAPVSPLLISKLIDPQKELTSWWTSQMNGAWKLCKMKWGTEQEAFKSEGGTQTTRGEPKDSEKLNYLIWREGGIGNSHQLQWVGRNTGRGRKTTEVREKNKVGGSKYFKKRSHQGHLVLRGISAVSKRVSGTKWIKLYVTLFKCSLNLARWPKGKKTF